MLVSRDPWMNYSLYTVKKKGLYAQYNLILKYLKKYLANHSNLHMKTLERYSNVVFCTLFLYILKCLRKIGILNNKINYTKSHI